MCTEFGKTDLLKHAHHFGTFVLAKNILIYLKFICGNIECISTLDHFWAQHPTLYDKHHNKNLVNNQVKDYIWLETAKKQGTDSWAHTN